MTKLKFTWFYLKLIVLFDERIVLCVVYSDEPVEHSLEWAFQRFGPWANSNTNTNTNSSHGDDKGKGGH